MPVYTLWYKPVSKTRLPLSLLPAYNKVKDKEVLAMEKRKLGKSELYINPVGLGCMGFSHAFGDPTEKGVAVRTLREAYEIGYDFFDTAPTPVSDGA